MHGWKLKKTYLHGCKALYIINNLFKMADLRKGETQCIYIYVLYILVGWLMCMQDCRTLLIFIIQCDLSLEFSLRWNRRTKKVQYGLALRSVSFRTAKLNFIYSMAACPKTSNSKCSLFDWILRCLARLLQRIYNILMRRLLRLFETIAEL